MSFQLRIDEMLQILDAADKLDGTYIGKKAKSIVTCAADQVAAILRDHFDIESGYANYDLGETMVPFFAAREGQALPEAMLFYDNAEEFEFVEVVNRPADFPDPAATLHVIRERLEGRWYDPHGDLESDIRSVMRGESQFPVADPLAALMKAEAFMAGFEGDEVQEGIDETLAEVRAAIAGLKGEVQ